MVTSHPVTGTTVSTTLRGVDAPDVTEMRRELGRLLLPHLLADLEKAERERDAAIAKRDAATEMLANVLRLTGRPA